MHNFFTKSDSWYYFAILSPILMLFFPILSLLPSIIKYFLLATTLLAVFILMQKHSIFQPAVFILFLAVIVTIPLSLPHSTGTNSSLLTSFYIRMMFWIELVIALIVILSCPSNIALFCKKAIYLSIAITAATTLFGLFRYPMASRELATGSLFENTDLYLSMNIGGFSFIYCCAIFLSVLAYDIRKSKGKKPLLILEYLLVFACVFRSQYMFAILISVFSVFILLFFNHKSRSPFLWLFVLLATAVILLFLFTNEITLLLLNIATAVNRVGFSALGDRFKELAGTLTGDSLGMDVSLRFNNYLISLRAFFKSPLFGQLFSSNITYGKHSELLDDLAIGGIFIVGIMAGIFVIFFKNVKKALSSSPIANYQNLFFLLFFSLAVINPILSSPEVVISTFLIPALLFASEKGTNRELTLH